MKKVLTVLLLLTLFPLNSFAQQGGKNQDILNDSLKDFSIVIGSGLGGAVLGLSTL